MVRDPATQQKVGCGACSIIPRMKYLERLRHNVSISNVSSAIDFDAVFQPNYPAEAWLKMFQSIDLDNGRQKALSRLVNMVLGKTVEERRKLVENLCKPKLRIIIKKGADKELESYEISRQLVIYALSSSDENLENMVQALDSIQDI